jgi:hypothetical protein
MREGKRGLTRFTAAGEAEEVESCLSPVFRVVAERAGIEPATDGVIRPLLVLKTSRNTSSILSWIEQRERNGKEKSERIGRFCSARLEGMGLYMVFLLQRGEYTRPVLIPRQCSQRFSCFLKRIEPNHYSDRLGEVKTAAHGRCTHAWGASCRSGGWSYRPSA